MVNNVLAAPEPPCSRVCGAAGDGVRVVHEQERLPVDLRSPPGRYTGALFTLRCIKVLKKHTF